MSLSPADLDAIWLSLRLASTVTVLLLVLGTPIAWWLYRSRSPLKGPVMALVALPLVLPPTVLGFYLLLAMSPDGPLGTLSQALGAGLLPFSFSGLVLASLFYSLPFVVQPLYNAMQAMGERPLEVAATLGASPLDRFTSVVLPQCKNGYLSAAILCFAHTIGEFGVVLMIGGNIPGSTQVVSVQLYEHVEALEYGQAHALAALLIGFAFAVLLAVYALNGRNKSSSAATKGVQA